MGVNINLPFKEGLSATEGMPVNQVATINNGETGTITLSPESGSMFLLNKLKTILGASCSIKQIKIDNTDLFISGEGADSVNFMDEFGSFYRSKKKIEVLIENTGQAPAECRIIGKGLKLKNKY